MSVNIDLGQAIQALSDALDLVGKEHVPHSKRVGFMALRCGEGWGLNPQALEDVFHAGLLHNCALSSQPEQRRMVNTLDWEGIEAHCVQGSALLEAFPPLAHLAPLVLYHHTHWDTLRDLALPAITAQLANLLYLVDQVDALAAVDDGRNLLLIRQGVREKISNLSGSFFAPELVTLFLGVSESEAFWLSLEGRHLLRFLQGRRPTRRITLLSLSELRGLAALFAHIVDTKSPYTVAHSFGTARLARFLASCLHLPPEVCDKIEVAALLHDLGKLRVPDEILEKPGPLTTVEWATVQRHSFETYQILRGITGLEDIALWAAYHHERPDGRGYPFRRGGSDLPIEARIIAVADVFEALTQNRPYRQSLSAAQTLRMLRTFAHDRHLDEGVVDQACLHLADCWHLAKSNTAPAPAPSHLAA